MPMTVWPSSAMNSFGAYVASEATISVPFDLIADGTVATIAAFALFAADVVAVVAVELELLLLPQPARARTASTGTPILAASLLMGYLLWCRWAPRITA